MAPDPLHLHGRILELQLPYSAPCESHTAWPSVCAVLTGETDPAISVYLGGKVGHLGEIIKVFISVITISNKYK